MLRIALFCLYCAYSTLSLAQVDWAPVCTNREVCASATSCNETPVEIVQRANTECRFQNITYSYQLDIGNNGSFEIKGQSDTLRAKLPLGTHRVYWRASDLCAMAVTCSYDIVVKDCNGPSLVCIGGLAKSLELNCSTSVAARQFIVSSLDNCTPRSQVEVGIRKGVPANATFPTDSVLTFDFCDKGFQSVQIWVRDKQGFSSFCNNYVLVQEDGTNCQCRNRAQINFDGCVRAGNGRGLFNYQLFGKLTTQRDTGAPQVQNLWRLMKDDSCFQMSLQNLPLRSRFDLNLRHLRNDSQINGFTTLDLALTSRHLLALQPFQSVYQLVAADVNRSRSLTQTDILEGRKLLLGLIDSFPNGAPWLFMRPSPTPNNTDIWPTIQEQYNMVYANVAGDTSSRNLDMVAIKLGDVNFSANLREAAPRAATSSEAYALTTANRRVRAGELVDVPIQLNSREAYLGWQLSLFVLPALASVEAVSGLSADQYHLTPDGWLRALNEQPAPDQGATLFTVRLRAHQDAWLSELIALPAEAPLPAEVYMGTPLAPRTHLLRWLPYYGQVTGVRVYAMHDGLHPYWNVETDVAARVELRLYNGLGQLCGQVGTQLQAGENQTLFVPNAQCDGGSGVYFYQILSNGRLAHSGRWARTN